MIIKFTTPKDKYGNQYTAEIDTDGRTVRKDFCPAFSGDHIEIKSKEMNKLFKILADNGFVLEP